MSHFLFSYLQDWFSELKKLAIAKHSQKLDCKGVIMKRTITTVQSIAISAALGLSLLISAPVMAQDVPTFKISMKNGVVAPTRVEVPKGVNVKLVVTNEGSATAEFESKLLHIEKVVAAGATITVTLRGLKAGSYEFVDEFTEDKKTAHGFIVAK